MATSSNLLAAPRWSSPRRSSKKTRAGRSPPDVPVRRAAVAAPGADRARQTNVAAVSPAASRREGRTCYSSAGRSRLGVAWTKKTTQAPRRVPPRPATIRRAYRVQPKESKGGSRSRAAGAIQLEAMFHLAVEASTPEVQLQCRRRSAALNTGRRRRFYDWWASRSSNRRGATGMCPRLLTRSG